LYRFFRLSTLLRLILELLILYPINPSGRAWEDAYTMRYAERPG
jgi:hypothetical protein